MGIVNRLRNGTGNNPENHWLLIEAADEIERLRELFELERKDNIDVRHHLAKANDQIERLRHEMERIADVSEQRWPNSLVSQINEIARAALMGGE